MRWLPAQDDLLLRMHKMRKTPAELAQRFDCTSADVEARLAELQGTPAAPEAPKQETGRLATPEEVERLKLTMNPLQRAFMDHCVHYNSLGQTMAALAQACERCLAAEELEKVILDCLEESRQTGETIAQKLARTLAQRCIVIPLPEHDHYLAARVQKG